LETRHNQPLPASLENVLIEDCLEELKKYENLARFNLQSVKIAFYNQPEKNKSDSPVILFETYTQKGYCEYVWEAQSKKDKIYIIQTLLSKGVMPFLDVKFKPIFLKELEIWAKNNQGELPNMVVLQLLIDEQPKTLRQELKKQFLEELTENGKTFDEALAIINLIYLQNA